MANKTWQMFVQSRLAAMFLMLSPGGVAAQSSDAQGLPQPLTAEAVRDLMAHLSDEQVRTLLLERLDAVAREQAAADPVARSFIDVLTEVWSAFYTPLVKAVQALPLLIDKQAEVFSVFFATFGGSGLLVVLGLFALLVAMGLAAETLVRRLLVSPTSDPAPDMLDASWLARRLGRDLAGLLVFLITVRVFGPILMTPAQLAVVSPAITLVVMVPRLVAVLSRFALAPKRPDYRIVALDDHWAGYLHRHVIGIALLGGGSLFLIGFNNDFGLPMGETMLGTWLTLALHLYIIVVAWRAREGLSQAMRGTDPDLTRLDERIAGSYPYFVIAVSVLVWVMSVIEAGYENFDLLLKGPQYTTMFWLLVTPVLDSAIRALVTTFQPTMIGSGETALRAHRSNRRSLIRVGRVLALMLVTLMVAGSWDLTLVDLASAGVGQRLATEVVEFVATIGFGYVVMELVSLWINRRLAREKQETISTAGGEGEVGGAVGSRLGTVLPVLLMTARIAIIVIFGLLGVGALGIDIAPLLAGAGILGLAIGFGAQKLVADVVSGVFFLFDDAFRIGEYIDVGGTMGTVEKTSVRSLRLRHHRGSVHTIPYGSIDKVTNFSRDWVIMKLSFTVPFETDLNKVKKVFKKIGAEMLEDPLFKNDFLEPFKSQGVLEYSDMGIVIRGKFMARPGTQFVIRKEILNRVGAQFRENGIDFARREVRVAMPGGDEDVSQDDSQRAAIKSAAGSGLEADLQAEAKMHGNK